MKKIGILSGLSLVLTTVILLSSCGQMPRTASSFDSVLNPDYDASEGVWKNANFITQLDGYELEREENGIALFSQRDSDGSVQYAFLNLNTGRVILTLVEEGETELSINLTRADMGVIAVEELNVGTGDWVHRYYDTAGNEVTKRENDSPVFGIRLGKLVVLDNVAYSLDRKTGALTKVMDVPEHLYLGEQDVLTFSEDYYYMIKNATVTVYDAQLNFASLWAAPSYVTMLGTHILDDGTVLIQYQSETTADATDFDYYENTNSRTRKYELVTLLLDPETGKTKELDLKYVVEKVITNFSVREDDNGYYNEDFENIAYLYPIVNQQVDGSEGAKDVVTMSNAGKIKKSLKIVDGQTASLPQKLGENVYAVSLLNGGVAIVDIDGEILAYRNSLGYPSAWVQAGNYFVSNDAIYDLTLNKVYDLRENQSIVRYSGENLILLKEGTDSVQYTYVFCNGEKTLLHTEVLHSQTPNDVLEIFHGIGYYIIDKDDGQYYYYNEMGEQLLVTTQMMYKRITCENSILCTVDTVVAGEIVTRYVLIQK